jgi:hypothetical protein
MRKPASEETRAKNRARALAWNAAHKDRAKRNARRYYVKNRTIINNKRAAYLKAHPDKNRAAVKKIIDRFPWYPSWTNAKYRCTNKRSTGFKYYGAKGIKFNLSKADMQFLWVRDNAATMNKPSIDRKDPAGDYTLDNCRFLERNLNSKRHNQRKYYESLGQIQPTKHKSWSGYTTKL